MVKLTISGILIAFGLSLSAQAQDTDRKLLLLTEQNPPHAYIGGKNGEIAGFSVEITKELMASADIQYDMKLLPWNRAYRQAQVEPNVCVFPANKTAEREDLFHWISPIQKGGWAIFKKAGSSIKVTTIDDLKKYSLIGKMASIATDMLEEELAMPIARAADDVAAIQLLYSGRVDLWLSGYVNASALATMKGLPAPEVAYEWKTAEFGIACSLKTNPVLLTDLESANRDRRTTLAER